MAFSKITKDMHIIAALDDEPNDVGGLSAAQLKAKFDEGGLEVKEKFNALVDALEAAGAESIGATMPDGATEGSVQEVLDYIHSEVGSAVMGQIPDASITGAKLVDGTIPNEKLATPPWTREQTLGAETRSILGLEDGTPPDTALNFFATFNKHAWKVTGTIPASYVIESGNAQPTVHTNYQGSTGGYSYSSSISVADDGTITLNEPVTTVRVTNPDNTYTTPSNPPANVYLQPYGHYSTSGTFYVDNPNIVGVSDSYPSSHIDFCIGSARRVRGVAKYAAGDESVIYDTNRSAYPDDGYVGDTHYQYLGVPYSYFPITAKIATGEYVGTGAGARLEADFAIRLAIIYQGGNSQSWSVLTRDSNYYSVISTGSTSTGTSTWDADGKGVSYSGLNYVNTHYKYILIGM